MTERTDLAIELFRNGYNCAQAVLSAYYDVFGLDKETAFAIASGFGSGIGGTKKNICGALSAASMLASLAAHMDKTQDPKISKKNSYALVQSILHDFEEKNSSIVCGDLLGKPGEPKLRSCTGCIEDSCELIEKYLLSK